MPTQDSCDASVAALAHDLRLACMRVSRRVRFETSTAVPPHQFSVLIRLEEQPRTLGEVATIEQVTPPSMSRTVSALVESGHVVKAGDAEDGRLVKLSLTDEGRHTIRVQRAERDAWMAARLEGLTAGQRQLLRRASDLLEEVVGQ